jgi:hypothetical protein
LGSVGSPASWSPTDHRVAMAGLREEGGREGRERERRLGRPGFAGPREREGEQAREWATSARASSWAERGREEGQQARDDEILFFFSKM